MSLDRALAEHMARAHPFEAAQALERAGDEAVVPVLQDLDVESAHRVLAGLSPQRAASVLAQLPEARAVALLEAAPVAVAAWLVRRCADDVKARLLGALGDSRSKAVTRALAAREGTAGAMVDPDVFALHPAMTVQESLERHGDDLVRATDAIPVVDERHRLVGMVALEALRRGARSKTIGVLAKPPAAVISDHLGPHAIVTHTGWWQASALPVVDSDGVLLGMLRYRELRALEKAIQKAKAKPGPPTVRALGELYGMAIGGFFEALVLLTEGEAR